MRERQRELRRRRQRRQDRVKARRKAAKAGTAPPAEAGGKSKRRAEAPGEGLPSATPAAPVAEAEVSPSE